jgi:predicted nucleic acid-binding protein
VVVLDSSFLIAFHNDRDVHHPRARAAMARLLRGEWGPALLPEYVFLEVVTVLLARRDLGVATRVGSALLVAKEVEFVACSDHFLEALDVFRNQGPGSLSFADAAIVAIARQRGARHVATFDAGFKKVASVDVVP